MNSFKSAWSKMRTVSVYALSFFLALYLAIILNLITLYRNTDWQQNSSITSSALTSVGVLLLTYGLFLVFSIFGRWIYRILLSFVILISVAAAYYMIHFNVVIGYGVLVSVLTTDVDLHTETLSSGFFIWVLLVSIIPLWFLWHSSLTHLGTRLLAQKTTYMCLILSLIIGGGALKGIDEIERRQAAQRNEFAPSPSGRIANSYLPFNWLTALGMLAFQELKNSVDAKTLFDPAQHFAYQMPDMSETYVVFVIGETTRSDRMSLFGYEKPTTPHLQAEKNLFAFRGQSCDTATKLSLKCMFVRPQGVQDDQPRTVTERNVFHVLKSLGLSSQLFALQSELWFYQSTGADDYKIREIITAENKQKNAHIDDMLLLEQMKMSMNAHPKGKHLIILHTKGSHFLYSQRYPQAFEYFQPTCKGISENCSLDELNNAFDNSVRYVDLVLFQVFNQLRDKKAIVFYSSDHGESIDENMHFHATPRNVAPAEQFRIPYLVWASDSFIKSTPERQKSFAHLKHLATQQPILSHQTLFDSVLGCIGVTAKQVDGLNPSRNICNTNFLIKSPDYPTNGALYP